MNLRQMSARPCNYGPALKLIGAYIGTCRDYTGIQWDMLIQIYIYLYIYIYSCVYIYGLWIRD